MALKFREEYSPLMKLKEIIHEDNNHTMSTNYIDAQGKDYDMYEYGIS